MLRFLVTRVSLVIPTFIGVTLLTFALIRLIPGDPIELLVGERGIDPARHAALRAEMGLDQPLLHQYGIYIWDVLQGDLGRSIVTRQPVLHEFFELFPATLELSLCAMLFALSIGLTAGVIAAVRRNTFFDHTVMGISLTGYSMPIFWWAILLILLFSVNLGWTPVSGRIDVVYWFDQPTGFMLIDSLLSGQEGAFTSAVRHLILPAIVLGTIPLAVIARMTRSSMLDVLGEDYVRTARAKGLKERVVIYSHGLRNGLIPVLTILGLQLGQLLAGAIIIENVYYLPGLGRLVFQAIGQRDLPVVRDIVLFLAAAVVVVNFIVDLVNGAIDPRVRAE